MFPHTPFSTPLSGSAKETQTRIRNIFQFQKKRPPVLVLTLAAALVLSCGGLVSCQSAGEDVSTVGRPTIEEPPEVENVSTVAWPMMGEPLEVAEPDWGYYGEYPGDPPLDGLTVEDLPTAPVNLKDFSQSESWNETVWLLSQDTQRDVALYGVIQFEDYEPGLTDSSGLYGVIVRSGAQWRFFFLHWQVNLWAGQAPELWFGDWDGDGQEELAFAVVRERGTSHVWHEFLSLVELDTLSYWCPNLSGAVGLTATYDDQTATLYAATKKQLLLANEASVSDAPILEGKLQPGDLISFFQRDGQLWCQVGFKLSAAPLADPVLVEYPIVFQDEEYMLGQGELSAANLPASAESASGADRLLWVAEDGQVMQAATQEEYEAGGTPVESEDGYLFYRF